MRWKKIVSLILWAIKLFELTMGAHIIWRLKKYCDHLSSSNSALILWKTVSCAALRTSKRGMAVATHAELLAAENELLAAENELLAGEGTSVMKENVTHETSQSDQNSKSIILRNPGSSSL
ncbi:hypothetical protein Bca52824_059070 [Brassica carinata]|uniref:Uncharacterized protein n=1 Tax=Brassica carinata TaxID=52824 RepID=A0A8X7QTQ6_BRACI|nr:hypothetical protein Bca52824_059070 [Brassica carinata]